MNQYTFHVTGTHCKSCKLLIEDLLSEVPGVDNAVVDLARKTVVLNAQDTNSQSLIDQLNAKLVPSGYSLSLDQKSKNSQPKVSIGGIAVGVVVLAGFVLLQKSGLLDFGIGGNATASTALLVGLVASVSSCLAIVGGLVLSLSAEVSLDTGGSRRPIVLFHLGRVVGFTALGGLLGLLGSAIGVNFTLSTILSIVAALVMIVLGLNLLGVLRRNHITLPTSIFRFFQRAERGVAGPLLLGIGTFFLPCGFTQSMQLAALSSGSWLAGASIMGAFALGTFPMLALLSFGSASFTRSRHGPAFFQGVGIVVIGLGLLSLLTGLASLGIIEPIISF